ncbi:Hypothetical protein, partial CDS, partial [Neorhizobium galegae bv. officinalis]
NAGWVNSLQHVSQTLGNKPVKFKTLKVSWRAVIFFFVWPEPRNLWKYRESIFLVWAWSEQHTWRYEEFIPIFEFQAMSTA